LLFGVLVWSYANAVIGAFTFVDFVLAFMPLTLIWGLKLDLKKKIGLAILLCCGAL
jgi:hypothetical protein